MYKSTKKHAFLAGAATVALTASASSMAFNLVPNGDFESGGDSFGQDAGGGAAISFESTGGNTGGYMQFDNTSAAWGGVGISTDDPAGALLADFGVVAGGTYDFQVDINVFSGSGTKGGLKLESWDENGVISDTGDIFFAQAGEVSGWNTYSTTYTIESTATRLKIVLLAIDNESVYGYDNLGIVGGTAPVPVPAAASLFGSAIAGLAAARRKK